MTENEKKKVMIIDDDTLLLDMYGTKFENSGFEVIKCQNAEKCIAKLEEGCIPHILLFDMIMPGITGDILIKKIKENNYAKGAKMFVLSNQGKESDIEDKIKELQVDGYIVKAMHTPSQVVEKVSKVLGVK